MTDILKTSAVISWRQTPRTGTSCWRIGFQNEKTNEQLGAVFLLCRADRGNHCRSCLDIFENRKCGHHDYMGHDPGICGCEILYGYYVPDRRRVRWIVPPRVWTLAREYGGFGKKGKKYGHISLQKNTDDYRGVFFVPVFRRGGRTGVGAGKPSSGSLLLGDGSVRHGPLENGDVHTKRSPYFQKICIQDDGERIPASGRPDYLR